MAVGASEDDVEGIDAAGGAQVRALLRTSVTS
jgi:hypothetical protein